MSSMRRGDGFLRQVLSLTLASVVALSPVGGLAADGEGGGAPGTLSVSTNPEGAAVYVDGRYVGLTPLNLAGLASGSHRVRAVKPGYLENARVVEVSADEASKVEVKLTPNTGDAAATAAQVTGGGGGGGGLLSNRWFWIGVAGAAGGGAYAYLATRNSPPVAGTATVSPTGTGLAGFTTFSFTSGASDPDRDPLTITWNFGDGGSGTGANVTHVYAAAGTYSASYTASDGKKTVTAPSVTVTVGRSLGGTWTGGVEPGFNDPFSISLTQTGSSLSGSTTFGSGGTFSGLTGSFTGTVYPVTVTYTQAYLIPGAGTVTDRFSGTTDAAGNTLTGTMTVTLPPGFVFTATRLNTATGPVTLRR
jgi:hypothetical protein